MSSPAATPVPAHGRLLALLATLAAALVPALLLAPHALAANGSQDGLADQRHLVDAVGDGFVGYWHAGDRRLSPDMRQLVDYWFRFHVAKAVIAALLLLVLTALGVLLWRAYARSGGPGTARRAALAAAGTCVAALSLLSLLVVMANVQGAAAPFTSLLSMLPVGTPGHGALADTLDQVRRRLTDASHPGGAPAPPALATMISDNSRYHATLAVTAGVVATVFAGMSVALWRRFARTGTPRRRTRRVLGSFGALSGVASLALVVLAVANTTTATDSARGLLIFFNGG
ncbi:hypothetical protein ACIRJO_20900 [Streptomyces sp. NPDC102394]|uniref:hypothetical protein n=1 Tax=Streptomyces sp. NPDC102394 TaxID=3366167 RepID=UPI0038058F4F